MKILRTIGFCIAEYLLFVIIKTANYYINDFVIIIFFDAIALFLGTILTSKLIPTEKAGNIGLIFIFALLTLDSIFNLRTAEQAILFIIDIVGSIFPVLQRIKKLRTIFNTPIFSTWNLNPDGTAQCNNCKHTVSFKDGPIFICPNCKADMRKPRQ